METDYLKETQDEAELPAGDFASWLGMIRLAQKSGTGSDVPCGDCTACCTSSYFIHVRPGDRDTVAHVPKKLLFPAPGLPGHGVLGYDEKGRCPMFDASGCSIYAHRPLTCRMYDCRVLAATGFSEADDRPLITRQVQRWKFGIGSTEDRRCFTAVRLAAAFLREHAERFPRGFIPANRPQQAMLALKVYEVFLDRDGGREEEAPPLDAAVLEAVIHARDEFDREENAG